ncbi:DUF1833 family protein [Desulfobacula phenolica]|uniref:Phage-related protein n=1 Tax=Desulfobacula phenolica TaxID=90732 RepID=A0A1H2H429_9BACT|nr:DUF1833 family protein [Desulfobacula phenolica]SDU26573.1 Phage-related protein [Desulfobacula phenolica]
MPIDLSSNQIIEKNKLSSDNIELLLLEITYESEDPVRVCLNNETISWNSYTWYPALFSISGIKETKDAEIPSVTLTFVDITRQIIPHIETYDGGVGSQVVIRVVDSKYLEETVPKISLAMEIIGCSISHSGQVTINLGAENLLDRRCPKERYLKNHCRYKEFGGSRCGYVITGSETCDRTFAACKALGNQARFGGFPGVGSVGFMA